MAAANAIVEADKFGVFLRIDGDRLTLKGTARPSDGLLTKGPKEQTIYYHYT